ncbi:diguanylate cyclase domain-containing protein [Planomicrobium sp. CPCC 101079]|uniref:sensor domain-containing diguanylate cyclase n=1 Tax=Planomicrobium sp. CPCC 101079 TaxID=2599618 RepID=UPI0011B54609|nr:diguanylate cyclase [Planomicrobium sp. CPCC 101079]TWT00973.1 diguanylate cyclase [Planomicrobium sp. CPCC 101079]
MTGPFTEQQLDLLYGKSENLVFLMKQTQDSYTYEYINPMCKTVFKKDLTGLTVDDSMPATLAAEIKKQYGLSLQTDHPYTYRDYNLFSEDRLATETEVTSFIHNGETYILAVSKNVSPQKKMEEDYSFYQSLVSNSVDPMIMVTANLGVFDMNPAYESTFGVRKEEWIGKTYAELPVSQKRMFEEIKFRLEKIIAGHSASSIIIERRKKDGQLARFSANYSPITENGQVRALHIVLRELTSETILKKELKKTENILESYKDALNYAALVAIWDRDGTIHFVNNNFKGTTGYDNEELLAMNIAEIGQAVITREQYETIRGIVLNGAIWRGEIKSLKKTGETFWVDATVIPLSDADGSISQVLSIMFNITDRKQLEEKLRFMAYHDRLTRLPNRQLFIQEFSRMKALADANKEQVGLLYLDGDDFKQINDVYGHDVGDEFIYHFGQSIQKSIRHQDLAARIGGDEFLVAISGLAPLHAKEQIEGVIERLKNNLAEGWAIGQEKFSPTVSLGVAIYPLDADNLDGLVKKADSALYLAKKQGKNQVHFINQE